MVHIEPNLVASLLCQFVLVAGYRFEIEIYRLNTDETWLLEVVDSKGVSHFWDEEFNSDKNALKAALDALVTEWAAGFWEEDSFLFLE